MTTWDLESCDRNLFFSQISRLMRLFLIGQIDNKESSVTDISAEQSQMFQLWFVFRFVCVSLDFVLWYISFCPPLFIFCGRCGRWHTDKPSCDDAGTFYCAAAAESDEWKTTVGKGKCGDVMRAKHHGYKHPDSISRINVSCVRLCKTKDKLQLNVSLGWKIFLSQHNSVFMLWLGLGTKNHLDRVGRHHGLSWNTCLVS